MDFENARKVLRFRGMLVNLFQKLGQEDVNSLALIYEINETGNSTGLMLINHLLKKELVTNSRRHLILLKESLQDINRTDLTHILDEYIEKYNPPFEQSGLEKLPTLTEHIKFASALENQSDTSMSGVVFPRKIISHRSKRPKYNLDEEVEDMTCDSTVSSYDEAVESTEEDQPFMEEAKEWASKSPDPETKVGAVLVKEGKVVGKGWNRMPTGCEGEFAWGRDRGVEPLENGKQLYVVYGIRAAIFDAYQNGADLNGSTLYTTLYPSNICAQCIRDAGIAEVVYSSNKFHYTKFVKASRRILEGIKCRFYKE